MAINVERPSSADVPPKLCHWLFKNIGISVSRGIIIKNIIINVL